MRNKAIIKMAWSPAQEDQETTRGGLGGKLHIVVFHTFWKLSVDLISAALRPQHPEKRPLQKPHPIALSAGSPGSWGSWRQNHNLKKVAPLALGFTHLLTPLPPPSPSNVLKMCWSPIRSYIYHSLLFFPSTLNMKVVKITS